MTQELSATLARPQPQNQVHAPAAEQGTSHESGHESVRLLAYRYLRLSRYESARPLIELALHQDPSDPVMRQMLVIALLGLGRAAEALEHLASPWLRDAGEAHMLRGRALSQLGMTKDAQAEYARYRRFREHVEYLP
ncbi:tetratricopeptide repeat protein [Noviherbaspirillum galbum]|uniref:Tetratricopeptide repeat protein n=1 Tax=Noviherbaspirillum galbum TaxID=2709383 RepID=A0A6B3SU24_9BURK|nr:tetratricopeptide repeat protein [Noviherbaspirillum galbum]NEX64227.1 hypothetical protein [Noviherbaspirillum galbum]